MAEETSAAITEPLQWQFNVTAWSTRPPPAVSTRHTVRCETEGCHYAVTTSDPAGSRAEYEEHLRTSAIHTGGEWVDGEGLLRRGLEYVADDGGDAPGLVAADRDVVGEIDRLVDEQLAGYDDRSGYDHNVNQLVCPHPWCHEDFHSLPIKERMRDIRRKWQSTIHYHEGQRRIPEDVVAELDAYRYDQDDSPVLCPGSLFEGQFEPPMQSRILDDDDLAVLVALLECQAGDRFPAVSPARGHGRIIGEDVVRQLRTLQCTLFLPAEWSEAAQQHIEHNVVNYHIHEATGRFPGLVLDPRDVRTEHRPDVFRHGVYLVARWWPRTNEVELVGGPANGRTVTVENIDRVDTVFVPRPFDVRDLMADSTGTYEVPPVISYRRGGWNTELRRWVYCSPDAAGVAAAGTDGGTLPS